MQFISFQKQRVDLGHISPSTVTNYYKATKLFIEMNIDAPVINWKRISKGLPRGRKAANDSLRRIKPIIYTMASSGIRLGAWDSLRWKHVTPRNENNEIIEVADSSCIEVSRLRSSLVWMFDHSSFERNIWTSTIVVVVCRPEIWLDTYNNIS